MRRLLGQTSIAAVLLLALLGGASLALRQLPGSPGVDDAYIFFRYARNLIEGHGLVWNPGGERVEGFTSPLWLVICAAAHLVESPPLRSLLTIGALLVAWSLSSVVWTVAMSRLRGDSQPPGGISTLAGAAIALLAFVAAFPPFVVWNTVGLMDSAVWSAMLALTWAGLGGAAKSRHHRPGQLSALLVLLCLARPEGIVVALSLLVFFALTDIASEGAGLAWRWRWPAAALLICVAGLLIARRAYFGFWFPNTYYAKVGTRDAATLVRGAAYVSSLFRAYPLFLVCAGLSAGALLLWGRALLRSRNTASREETPAPLLLAASAGLVYLEILASAVVNGGDHFYSWRFLQPAAPLAFVVLWIATNQAFAALAKAGRPSLRSPAMTPAAVASLCAFSYIGGSVYWPVLETSGLGVEFWVVRHETRLVGIANRVLEGALPRVGVLASGEFGYAYAGESVDLLALNNVAMAHATGSRAGVKNHAAFDPDTFYGLGVELMALQQCRWPGGQKTIGPAPLLKGIEREPRFVREYVPVAIATSNAGGPEALCGYASRDWVLRARVKGSIHALE